MNAIVPIPKCEIAIRPATMADLPFLDGLQKQHNKALGYFPTKQFEGYIQMGGVLIAESAGGALGYCISRDRYLKRDELGVIYQLCVAPGAQRKLVGAALVREVFARSAYGCRLYCCWCAQDLEANHFWESMGFVPIAFRAGSSGKKRVHIFWQKRIVEGDAETKWWYPNQTNQGAIREDRLVFPIPPGVHWSDAMPVVLPGEVSDQESGTSRERDPRKIAGPKQRREKAIAVGSRAVGFGFLSFAAPAPAKPEKPKREKPPRVKTKNDPKLVAAARELRDRWMERVNEDASVLLSRGKYEVSRQIASETPMPALPSPKALPAAA